MRAAAIALLLFALAMPARAQDAVQDAPAVQASSVLAQREVSIGDEFVLRVQLPDGMTGSGEPRVESLPEGIVAKSVGWAESQTGEPPRALNITLASFNLDATEVPQFRVSWFDAEGKKQMVLTTPHSISMKRLTSEDEQTLKDVKGPQGAELSWGQYVLYGLGLALLLALGVWLVRRYLGNRGVIVTQAPPSPPVPAHETALEALRALEARDLPGEEKFREQCFELSEIFRAYLEGRYEFPASEQTTDELRRAIKNVQDIDEKDRDEALALLEEWDLVKFAKVPIPAERARYMLVQTREWVTRTIPVIRVSEGPSALDIAEGRARP